MNYHKCYNVNTSGNSGEEHHPGQQKLVCELWSQQRMDTLILYMELSRFWLHTQGAETRWSALRCGKDEGGCASISTTLPSGTALDSRRLCWSVSGDQHRTKCDQLLQFLLYMLH